MPRVIKGYLQDAIFMVVCAVVVAAFNAVIVWDDGLFLKIVMNNVPDTRFHLKTRSEVITPALVRKARAKKDGFSEQNNRFTLGHYENVLSENDSTAFIVMKNGSMVVEKYWQGRKPEDTSMYFSITKAIVSLLVEIYSNGQNVDFTNAHLTDYISTLDGRYVENLTISQLMNMQSGLSYSDYGLINNPLGKNARILYTSDLEAELSDLSFSHIPGSVFDYQSVNYALIGIALTNALENHSLSDYFEENIWQAMEAEHFALWSTDDSERTIERTWCCLAGSARDLVKLGNVLLNNGKVRGKQLIPQTFFAKLEQAFMERPRNKYFEGFWLMDPAQGDYRAEGVRGQFLYINPTEQVVIVRLGNSKGDLSWQQWADFLSSIAGTFGQAQF